MAENWPQYSSGPPEHLHALGLIATGIAEFDAQLFDLYLHQLNLQKVNQKVSEPYYFEKSDDKRLMLIKRVFADFEKDENVTKTVEALIKYYEWATQTRGILLHARHAPPLLGQDANALYLAKQRAPKKSSALGYLKLDLKTLRKIADQIYLGAGLASELNYYLTGRDLADAHTTQGIPFFWQDTLPEIPAPPESLTLSDRDHNPPMPAYLRQSSDE